MTAVPFHPRPLTTPPITFGAACRDLDTDGPDDRYLHRLVAAYAPYHNGATRTTPALWQRVNPGFGGYFNLKWLAWDRVCPTIPNMTTTVTGHVHPRHTRYLSLPEAKRCATFPEDFAFVGGYEPAMRRIGNSVPPALMRAVAGNLRRIAPLGDRPTVISTFAGCGGSSLGYRQAGYDERLVVEWDDNAVATFRLNFPDVPVYHGDIKALTVADVLARTGLAPGELDVLDGSPPCQGFSTAGNRILDDPRNDLFREFVRLLGGLQPRAFVMENVSGMVKGKMKLAFVEILAALKGCGYHVSARVLNAMYYGVPQSRERLIFVGLRADLGLTPAATL